MTLSLPKENVISRSDGRTQPNLLFIFSDEHRACSLSGEPYCDVQTTHLIRLAREGTVFDNCISNYPVCSPYRAMLLSGRWPFQTGVVDNALRLPDEEFSLGEAFRCAGYQTGYIGKWHLSRGDHESARFIPKGPARQGFEDWQVWSNTRRHFGAFTFDPDTGQIIRREGYSATLMTDAAIDYIGTHTDKPWLLVLSWGPPHPPFESAPPEMMRLYVPELLQLRPNVPAERAPLMRERLRGYYGHISALDSELGRLLDKLDETGQATNTIVVYTSDHGTMLGLHRYGSKRLPFDEACKVPFLLRYPGVVPANRTTDVLLGAIDLFPSLCGLSGVPIPPHCEGTDLSEAMRGGPTRGPESAFLMHIQRSNAGGEAGKRAPLFRGVRTQRFTYAVADSGRWCLYDNKEDPYQMRNLIDDPACASTESELNGLVFDWLARAHDPFPLDVARRQRSPYV
ncbi:MAG TPA: sulfatase [Casimicrobiaceae bacterium]|nr:sulfatase [Casimicrobiaceae bacterium]